MEQGVAERTSPRKIGEFVAEDFVRAPAIIFFAIGFNVVIFSTNLILNDNFLQLGGFVVATMAALVVGKAVLVAETMPFLRRFESAPLIAPVLLKTCVYTLFVLIARLIGAYIHYMINEGRLIGISSFMYEQFSSVGMPSTRHLPGWHRFMFIQLWIFVLFLIYTTGSELNRLLGYGMLAKLFFTHRSSTYKRSRRERIRTLVELSRVTERHSVDGLQDLHNPVHRQMVALLTILVADRRRTDSVAGLSAPRPTAPTVG